MAQVAADGELSQRRRRARGQSGARSQLSANPHGDEPLLEMRAMPHLSRHDVIHVAFVSVTRTCPSETVGRRFLRLRHTSAGPAQSIKEIR